MSKEGTATLEGGVLELRWVGVARKLGDGRASPPKDKLFGVVGEGTGAVGTQHQTHGLFISFDVAETLLDVAFGR